MSGLSPSWVLKVHEASLAANLGAQITALRSMLPPDVNGALTSVGGGVGAQLLVDLNTLNNIAKNGNSEPLSLWLQTSRSLAGAYASSASVFSQALAALLTEAQASPAANRDGGKDPSPVTLPKPDNHGHAMRELRELLLSLFSTSELKVFVSDHYPDMTHAVSWQKSPVSIAHEVTSSLGRSGHIDTPLFNTLSALRQGRRHDIEKVKAAFGV